MVNKERHINFYNLFKENGWNGLLNHGEICLSDFTKQDPDWNSTIDNIDTLSMVNDFIQHKAEQFGEWAISQSKQFKRNDYVSWFKGTIGEYIWAENGTDIVGKLWDKLGYDYALENIVPASFYRLTDHTRTEFGEDFGVDLVATNRQNEVCVCQVKTWNIWGKEFITYGDIVANLFTDGIMRGWIYPNQPESMFILWFGMLKNIAKPLNTPGCPLYKKVQYYGFEQLQSVFDGWTQFFDIYNNFKKSLKNISNYKFNCEQTVLTKINTL